MAVGNLEVKVNGIPVGFDGSDGVMVGEEEGKCWTTRGSNPWFSSFITCCVAGQHFKTKSLLEQ
jgi:hypothetical protein